MFATCRPRRFGKSMSVALFIASMLLCCADIRICVFVSQHSRHVACNGELRMNQFDENDAQPCVCMCSEHGKARLREPHGGGSGSLDENRKPEPNRQAGQRAFAHAHRDCVIDCASHLPRCTFFRTKNNFLSPRRPARPTSGLAARRPRRPTAMQAYRSYS